MKMGQTGSDPFPREIDFHPRVRTMRHNDALGMGLLRAKCRRCDVAKGNVCA